MVFLSRSFVFSLMLQYDVSMCDVSGVVGAVHSCHVAIDPFTAGPVTLMDF